MAKALDKSRDFGSVYGSESGVRYVQDGLEFDAQGDLLTTVEPSAARKTRSAKPRDVVKDTATVFSSGEQIFGQEGEL